MLKKKKIENTYLEEQQKVWKYIDGIFVEIKHFKLLEKF